jgi:TRAP-type mannitol/chloroaromatic compound transport system permease large subunit
MLKAGYPPPFAASVTAAAGSTDILIPPSVAFIIYSVLVPSATVPALFAAGIGPGILACVMLIIPALLLSLYYNFGAAQSREPRPKLWQSFKEAFWALMAPIVILGGLRTGWFTPTEAAVMAVFYGLLVGICIYRTLTFRDIFELLVESAETSAVILIVVALASVFAWASSTLGIVDPIAEGLVELGGGETGVILLMMLFLVIVGMFLDGISIFLIFSPVCSSGRELPVGSCLVRSSHDLQHRPGAVHTSHGSQSHGQLQAYRVAHGGHGAVGILAAHQHVRRTCDDHSLSAYRTMDSQNPRVYVIHRMTLWDQLSFKEI